MLTHLKKTFLKLRSFLYVLSFAFSYFFASEDRKMELLYDFFSCGVSFSFQDLWRDFFSFLDKTAEDVMMPRVDIVAFPDDTPIDMAFFQTLQTSPYAYYPIYSGDFDNIIGLFSVRDLLLKHAMQLSQSLADYRSPVLFISPTMNLFKLFVDMRARHIEMALVVDDYGDVDGLVTVSMISEALFSGIKGVGGVEEANPFVRLVQTGVYVIHPRLSLDRFEHFFAVDFSVIEEDFAEIDTIGGAVSQLFGHLPKKGEVLSVPQLGMSFEILESERTKIQKLKVTLLS